MRAWWTQLAPKKNITPNETRSQASSQEAQIFFPLGGGREWGRVKIEVLMKAVGGGEASEHLWRGWAVLSLFWRLAPMRYSRAFSFCRHLFSHGIYVPLFLASRILLCLALPCPPLHCTSLVRFVAKKCSQQPIVGCHRLHTSTSSALHRESFLHKLRFLF